MVSGLWTAYRNKERLKQKLRAQKGNRPNKRYEDMELRNLASGGMKPYDIDEITWNDLSMDELFARVDYTYSQSGEQVLYEILRNPTMDETVLRHREEVISFFAQNDDARIKMQLRFAAIGRNGKYSLPQYLSYLESAPQKSNLKDGIVILDIFLSAIVEAGLCGNCSVHPACLQFYFLYERERKAESLHCDVFLCDSFLKAAG